MDGKTDSELLPLEKQESSQTSQVPEEGLSPEVAVVLDRIETPEHWMLERPGWDYDEERDDLEQFILTGALEAESILTQKGIDPSERKFMMGFDYDGPINTPHNESMEAPEGFHEGREAVPFHEDWLREAVISGRDMDYLQNAIHNSIGLNFDLAGQHGAVYMPARDPGSTASKELEGDFRFLEEDHDSEFDGRYEKYTTPDWDDRVLLESVSRTKAAEENRKLIWATSRSPVAGTLTVEGAGENVDGRTGLRGNTYFAENYVGSTIDEVYETLEKTAEMFDMENDFEKDGDEVRYKPNDKNEEILSHALSVEKPFTELRFDRDGDEIIFEVDEEADEGYELVDADRFLNEVTETVRKEHGVDFGYDRNSDWWLDFYLESDISKGRAAQAILEDRPAVREPSDALVAYTGDRPGDVLEEENALNYVQIGEDSHRHSYENGIPSVLVNNAADYQLINAELFHRNKEGYES